MLAYLCVVFICLGCMSSFYVLFLCHVFVFLFCVSCFCCAHMRQIAHTHVSVCNVFAFCMHILIFLCAHLSDCAYTCVCVYVNDCCACMNVRYIRLYVQVCDVVQKGLTQYACISRA